MSKIDLYKRILDLAAKIQEYFVTAFTKQNSTLAAVICNFLVLNLAVWFTNQTHKNMVLKDRLEWLFICYTKPQSLKDSMDST